MSAHESSSIVAVEPLPASRCAISIRTATLEDAPFIDELQKMHSHMVGWFPRKQMESYIEGGHVLIAESDEDDKVTGCRGDKVTTAPSDSPSPPHQVTPSPPHPLGYCIFKDQYLKRDDVGIIYQLNVQPMKQRHLIGATLVKAAFERAAYGCKLFCCWCAQDIQANFFWESIGFVPLAFRTGSRGKQRIHIFWQRRINQEVRNADGTSVPPGMSAPSPYWYPYQTSAGSVREDRLVLPIPDGVHWRDPMPLVLPSEPVHDAERRGTELPKTLPGGAPVKARPDSGGPKLSAAQKAAIRRSQSKHLGGVPLGKKAVITSSGFKYVDREDYVPELDAPEEMEETKPKKPRKPRAPRQKHDPKHVKQARELRDRYLEEVNAGRLLPSGESKYDVSRQIGTDANAATVTEELRFLDAA